MQADIPAGYQVEPEPQSQSHYQSCLGAIMAFVFKLGY
jgi:hypothetical protein